MLPAENVVRRIAANGARVDEPGAFGIRPEPAAAILRRHGGQTRRAPGARADGRFRRKAEGGPGRTPKMFLFTRQKVTPAKAKLTHGTGAKAIAGRLPVRYQSNLGIQRRT